MITQSELKQVLHYEPDTGVFTWLFNGPNTKIGMRAGSRHRNGYVYVKFMGERHPAHRLACLYMNGRFPSLHVDHINLNRSDNRWSNLREVSQSLNVANRSVMDRNKTGLKGAYYEAGRGKWRAAICKDGVIQLLGRYDCPAAANLAYQIAADKLFGAHARVF